MLLFRVLILVCNGLDPCQNGGSCVDGVNTFSCLWLPGFTGDKCQTDMNECLSEPCKNGGTCSDYVNSYTCKCPAGFDGVHCENNIDECTERWAARVLRQQCLMGKGRERRNLQSTILGLRGHIRHRLGSHHTIISYFLVSNSLWTSSYKFKAEVEKQWDVQFSRSVVSDSLRPHKLQHVRPPCPSPTPRVHPNPCPLSQWCHPTISSSVIPFSSCPQSFPASGSFQMSHLFTSGGQSIGVSASTSVLPMNTQDWSPLGWTGWISLQSRVLSRVFSNMRVQKHQFFGAQRSL